MKTAKRPLAWRVSKALKPRNPVIAALKANLGARAGSHGKDRKALRRAAKMAMVKDLSEDE